MNEGDNKEEKTPRRWFTVERVLLTAVLILQVGILLRIGRSHETTPEPQGRTGLLSGPESPRRSLPVSAPAGAISGRHASHRVEDHDIAAYRSAQRMFDEMDRMVNVTFDELERLGAWSGFDHGWDRVAVSPACDLRDRNGFYEVAMSLPEVSPSGLEVLLDNQILTIRFDASGTHPFSGQRASGAFEQRIRLPGPVADVDRAVAKLTNGILRVSIPKGAQTATTPVLRLF